MHSEIYVNLPVADMARAQAFWRALGYDFNPQFTNDKGACLILGETLRAMLLTHDFMAGFTNRPIADARQSTEVLVCLRCESRAEVDALVAKAVAAGGSAPRAPQDHGFMYAHGFEDLDGHLWELVAMSSPPA